MFFLLKISQVEERIEQQMALSRLVCLQIQADVPLIVTHLSASTSIQQGPFKLIIHGTFLALFLALYYALNGS